MVLANTGHARARGLGITAGISAIEEPKRVRARTWAEAFHAAGFRGMRYRVSHDPSQRAIGVALFGPVGEADWPAGAHEQGAGLGGTGGSRPRLCPRAKTARRRFLCGPRLTEKGGPWMWLHNDTTMNYNGYMPKGIPLTVRLPEDLHAALVERAQLDARSLNGEIVFLLRESLFPLADADAYRHTRTGLRDTPKYTLPRPTARRRLGKS
jgi:hypothetical protein